MLATMATVTSGILSPNSYVLNTDAVALKLSHPEPMETFHNRHSFTHTATYSESHNSSDSEQEVPYNSQSPNLPLNISEPKRNKRKNFKPRYSQNLPSEDEGALNLSEYNENNNVNNNVRRRKPLAGIRKVIQDSSFTPMDLSGSKPDSEASERLSHDSELLSHDSENKNDSDNSDSDDFNTENYRTQSDNEETKDDSEDNESSKIPSSFSIHNLSKPHVSKTTTSMGQNLSPDQISEMRNYAMNTMRELLGIYGLTSEVAESISRQLPLAAFTTGKIFENLSLTAATKPSLSEPPTPPSTPLSPKQGGESTRSAHFNQATSSSHFSAMGFPMPLSHSGMTNQESKTGQSFPLNLNMKKEFGGFVNGSSEDFEDGMRNKGEMERDDSRNTGIFSGNLAFTHLSKTDSTSPPPMESPLSAMMHQSMSTSLQPRDSLSTSSLLLNKTSTVDYSKYVKKFSSSVDCGSTYCKDLNYREHFHCLDCNSRVFIKKEEMIRHFKWHKKRDESLQHGFMRYSPLDDCGDRFANCTHNKKQTHYHCIQENCDKVYISTSDVQMHSNYHRKDSAIMQEGFQRYRATEECGASYCAFFGQRTTHFHCRRSGCRFTFKNKSDMEKHKSYHIKDEQLSRDGFKKFMKNEVCPFENCRFSKVCNHIHCIRPQCSYVLHSSGQLFSHKRKHERKDSELAYRKYKLAQSMMKTLAEGGIPPTSVPVNPFNSLGRDYEAQIDLANFYNQQNSLSNMSNVSNTESLSDRNSPLSYNDESEGALAMDLSASEASNLPPQEDTLNSEDFWRKYCQFVPESQQCNFTNCEYAYQEHFHCVQDNCEVILTSKEGAKEHSRNHEQQEIITDNFFSISEVNEPCEDQSCMYQSKEKHYHCNLDSCREVILSSDKPFRRLEHYKMHQYSQKLSLTKDPLTATHLATSIDGMFCRKRGRPPKNRVIEVWNDYNHAGGNQNMMDSPQAIFTSFKLPKPSATLSGSKDLEMQDEDDERVSRFTPKSPSFSAPAVALSHMADYANIMQTFDTYGENTKCPDTLCPYLGASHFHCNKKRCLYSTDQMSELINHAKDFHENVEILEGFEFYDRMVDCRLQGCASNKINRHFHCTRPNCNYSFVQYSQMAMHNHKHDSTSISPNFPSIRVKSEELLVEKHDETKSGLNLSVVNLSQGLSDNNKISDHQQLPATFDPQTAPSTTLYGPEVSCSRPFCKLKRKPHYHCNACNQAFSELDKLLPHVARHNNSAMQFSNRSPEDNNLERNSESNNNGMNGDDKISAENLSSAEGKISIASLSSLQNNKLSPQEKHQQSATTPKEPSTPEATPYFSTPTFDAYNHFSQFPPNFATQIALMQQQNAFSLPQSLYQQGLSPQMMFQHAQLMQSPLLSHQAHPFPTENLTSPLAAMAANLNKRSLSPHEMSPEAKKARIQNSMRILKDEPVPAGYLRFRFNEDCKYQHCGYREHQTHFHCQRQDCGYSFCDKTRFVQHTARHERLDTLMGGDFQQYRANVACGRPDCAYTANLGSTQNKASHFHCLKCEFVCTDTNKVVAHRRQHQKLDSIQAAGFEKFTPSQICRVQNCQHSGKQTHYHCLSCQYAVLGLAQMSAHKYRHMEG
ncbi:zinc finger protein castor homolog 1-like isoform X2 [Anthonomus grandis grandis]|uniref:zinc finger protein castor homolog 1-like isoform X2 n=1 Tax=Anthonomus grandis grandis TaxID=2921223 RepID=UPI0021662F6F|nr:zinc finger protein castor homolog 1-like isoform X2 [Anthonomus grandis grandis]